MNLTDEDSISLVCAALGAVSYDCVMAGAALNRDTVLTDLGIDSIQVMECLGILEEICGFTLPDSALNDESLRTVEDFASIVRLYTERPVMVPPGGWAADPRLEPMAGPTLEQQLGNTQTIALTRAILGARQRAPLFGSSAKVLGFMLGRDEGCDCAITPERFEVQFGWLPYPSQYSMGVVPSIVSHLLGLAKVEHPVTSLHFQLAPGRFGVHENGHDYGTSYGAREVWIRDEGELVRIAVRRGPARTTGTLWPAPLKR